MAKSIIHPRNYREIERKGERLPFLMPFTGEFDKQSNLLKNNHQEGLFDFNHESRMVLAALKKGKTSYSRYDEYFNKYVLFYLKNTWKHCITNDYIENVKAHYRHRIFIPTVREYYSRELLTSTMRFGIPEVDSAELDYNNKIDHLAIDLETWRTLLFQVKSGSYNPNAYRESFYKEVQMQWKAQFYTSCVYIKIDVGSDNLPEEVSLFGIASPEEKFSTNDLDKIYEAILNIDEKNRKYYKRIHS